MTLVKTKSERVFGIDLARVALFFYFVTFGFFGYGSAIEPGSILTWLPSLSGLLCTLLLAFSRHDLSMVWSLRLVILRPALLQYVLLLAALSFILGPSIGGELTKDELAHVRLASTHAREILERFALFESSMASSTAIQILSATVVITILVPVALVAVFAPLKKAFILIALLTTVFQVGYWFFGSWGWGYAELSWFPFLLTSSIFGFYPIVFSFTSVALVAAGLFAFYRGLERLGISQALRIVSVATVATIPLATPFFSAVDHVIYYAIFGLPALLIIASKPDYRNLKFGVLLLSVGVLFRITLVVPLLVMIILFLINCRRQNKSLWAEIISHPGLMLLTPYGIGFLLFPPLFSGGVASVLTHNQVVSNELLGGPLREGIGEAGIFLSSLIIAGLLASLFSAKRLAISVTFVLTFAYLYLYVLAGTDLSGDPRYSAEWLLTLTAWSLILLLLLVVRFRRLQISWIPVVSYLGFASLILSTNLLTIANQNSVVGIEGNLFRGKQPASVIGYMEAQAFFERNPDLECTPIGQVYGASNELLAGRDISSYKRAIATFFEVQSSEVAAGGVWTSVSASTLEGLPISCLYGSRDAFNGIDSGMWEEWHVVFPVGIDLDVYSVRVLTRDR